MPRSKLKIFRKPRLVNTTLVLGMSGWMNGGEVSTGTVQYLKSSFQAEKLADIEPEGFFLYTFPGPMEISALFRPHTRIADGLIEEYEPPKSEFYFAKDSNLILFSGKEPNLNWDEYAGYILSICTRFNATRIYSIGSVAGLTPHTREPMISFSTTDATMRDSLIDIGLKPVNYEGPASFITSLTMAASKLNICMVVLVAEIPAYVDGYNPRCIETAIRCIARMCDMKVDLAELRSSSQEFEEKLNNVVANHQELADKVKDLEIEYDRNAFSRDMPGLKNWLGQQGIRVE